MTLDESRDFHATRQVPMGGGGEVKRGLGEEMLKWLAHERAGR